MAEDFIVDMVSPENVLASGACVSVVVPGSEGWFTAMPGHEPLIAMLKPGVVVIKLKSDEKLKFYVAGGFVELTNTNINILADEAVALSEIDQQQIQKTIADAKDDLAHADSDKIKERAAARLERWQNMADAIADHVI